MSLNKFMHQRNQYKNAKPNFQILAEKYKDFKKLLFENEKGKLVLDFKDPQSVKVLTVCLLREDFGLTVDVPPDRLVPTLPLRLNYVHWIEDITSSWEKDQLSAVDIGTGCCCIYPCLATALNQWRFVATESDDVNFIYAKENVERNNLSDKIKVVHVPDNVVLKAVVENSDENFDFCMCNPPFFSDAMEAQGLFSRSNNRPQSVSMSTASPQESIVPGGEIGFVKKLIVESTFLRCKVRLYTTMLGKKSSVAPLMDILRTNLVENFSSTEFCQGRTMRWGLAWTFDNTVHFPKSEFSQAKKGGRKTILHIIPTQLGEIREAVYSLVDFLKEVFEDLKIHFRSGKQMKSFSLLTLTAPENTWIHSRQRRRQRRQESAAKTSTVCSDSSQSTVTTNHVCGMETQHSSCRSVPSHACSVSDVLKGGLESGSSGKATGETSTAHVENGEASFIDRNQCGIDNTSQNDLNSFDGNTLEQGDCNLQLSGELSLPMNEAPFEFPEVGRKSHSANSSPHNNYRKPSNHLASCESSLKKPKLMTCDVDGRQGNEEVVMSRLGDGSSGRIDLTIPNADTHEATDDVECGGESDASDNVPHTVESRKAVAAAKDTPPSTYILKCHLSVRVQHMDLAVEMTWLDGQDIQLMHQLMQCVKNRLANRESTQ